MHMNSNLTSPVIDAFDSGYPSPADVIEHMGGEHQARQALGRLWNCTDILPGDIYHTISTDWPEFERASTFGRFARSLIDWMR